MRGVQDGRVRSPLRKFCYCMDDRARRLDKMNHKARVLGAERGAAYLMTPQLIVLD